MRKKRNLLLICCFVFQYIQAQTLSCEESVANLLRQAQTVNPENINTSLELILAARQQATSCNNSFLVYKTYRSEGMLYEEQNKLSKAEQAYAQALTIANQQPITKEFLYIYTDWAILHKKMGNYRIAQEYHLKSIEKASLINDWEMIEEGYHGLGTMYSMMSDFDKAIAYYFKSIEAAEHCGNHKGIVLTRQNIGNCFMKAKNYEMARKTIEETYQMALALNDSIRLGAVLTVYGNIEVETGNLELALQKHLIAKQIFEKYKKKNRIAESLAAIGEIYFKQKNYPVATQYWKECLLLESAFSPYLSASLPNKMGNLYAATQKNNLAINAFEKSLKLTNQLGFREVARENYLALADIYKKSGQYNTAFEALKKANLLSDSLFQEDKQKNMTYAQFHFDVQKRDLEIESQKHDLENAKYIRYILGLGLLILSVLLFFTWKQMKAKQKAQQKSELMLKELHHRVKNNLQTVTSIMRMQARQVENKDTLNVLNESRQRIEAISMLHQQLYREEDIQVINIQAFLEDLIEKLAFTYNFPIDMVNQHIEVVQDYIDIDTALPIALIINELVTNSFKHAFQNDIQPNLSIVLNNEKLHYADNGIGLDKKDLNESSKTLGLQLIGSLSKQLKGSFRFYNQNGLHFELLFNA